MEIYNSNFFPITETFIIFIFSVLHLKCKYEIQAEEWKKKIENVCITSGQIWLKQKRFGSSFPERDKAFCEWFVDSRAYFEKAAAFMEMAREEIL